MFSHCASLTSLADNTSSSMKPTALTTTYQMFAYSGVKSLSNMVQFDTSNITNANYMFYYSSINDLTGLSKFPLTKANASAQYMFSRCSSLRYTKSSISNETVDFSGVTNMSYMFANCSSLYDLDNMIIFTLNPKANMSHMFDNCDSLYRITGLSRIDMSRPADESVEFGINLNYMFYDCNNLYYISTTGTEYKTSGVTNMSFMFSECDDYYFNAFDFGCWDLSNVTTMQYMLSYCAYLNTVTFSKATNSTQLTSTSYMFYNTKLQTINNIENFDTSNVVTMNYMFASCKFTTLDISKLNTASVTTTADMFASNSNLTSITFDSEGSTFSTSKVTNFSWMFSSCSKLITINMSNFDTSNATTMSYMFYNCSELTSLDVSTFNTEKVTTVGYMFRNTKIVSLDISNFDLTSLTNSNVNYSGILYQMSSLKELYTPHAVPSTFSISIPSTLYMQNTDGTYSGTNALQNNSSYAPFLSVKDADSGEITKTRLAAKYTISYSGASGATHDNPTEYLFSMEEQVITLTTPIKWAYKFTGWTVGSNTSYSLDANTLTLNPQCAVNISLTMTWKNGDKLTFHAKGADGDLQADDATYSSTQEYYSLENYPYGDLKIPTSAFFDFVGYWDGSDPTSLMTPTSINEANQTGYFDKICVIDQSHELYAKWTKKTFTITFEISPDVSWGQIYENGTGYTTLTKNAEYDTNITYSNNILYIGDDIVISAVANDFIGFKTDFSAWYINGTSDTDHIQYYGNKITSNIIVYAMFIQGIETFTLTIDQPFNVTSNQTDTTIAVTSYGDLSQIPYNSVLSVDANNTLLINTGTTTKQVTITQASITGYSLNFLGWYIGNLKIDNIYLRSNLSATPKFEKVVHSYTLSFNVDEKGTLSNTNISLNYGQSFSVSGNTATHSTQNVVATSATSLVAGYHNVFNGYYYGANKLTGNILVTETLFTLPDNNGTIDINVVFDAIANQYTLKFDKNDTDLIGSASISPNTALTITYGSNYPTLPTGFLTGYTFNNWLLDLDNPTSVINPTKTVAIEAEHDAEVFAHATWTIKQYTIDVKINPEHSTYAILSSTGTLSTVPYNTLISIDSQQTEEVPTLTGTTEVVKTSILSILSTNFTATRRNATGYTTKFVKWTVNGADLLTDYTVGDTTSTIEILAHFERTANSYKLNFDLNASSLHLGSNATLVGSVPTFITYNSPYGTLPQGSLNGYTFLNWKKDGNIVSADTVVDTTEEITLVAEWEIIKYTISFESNNNEYGSIQNGNNLTIDYYTSITINNNVITIGATNITALVTEKPGYTTTFKDWTTNSLALTEITVTGDMNFVANFLRTANEYTITFVFNNGTADKTQKVTFGKPYNLNGDFPTSSLEGYNFSGWFLDDTTFTQQISEVDNVNIPNNHSLFAWWSINLFEISFEVNDLTLGDISPKSTISDVAYGTIITLGTNSINIGDVAVINASLNAFDGYTTAVEWEIEGHTLDNQFKITRSSTIKAVFSKTANTYKISFNVNTVDSNGEGLKGGTPELNGDENKDVVYDSTYDTLPEPTLTGYDFAGWYIGANKINETSIVKILEDSTLQAKWNIQYKTITININNAELGTVNTSTLTNIKYYSTLKTVAGSNEITAVMSTIDPSVTNTKTAKATPITKTGYTTEFINWTLDGNEISTLTIVEDITITAQFNRYANTYSVTFKANGGTPVTTSKTVVFDQKYGTLPVVTKTGHTFDIWTDEFGNEITSDTILSIAKNHDITAQWIVNKYNVSFVIYNDSLNIVDDEVGEVEQTTISNVHYNSTISQTGNVVSIIDSQTAATTNNTATKKLIIGYHVNFDRFTIDNVKFTNYVIPANDVTIEVRFTKVGRKYIVTFDSTGGTDAESIEVTYGSPYGELPSPTKTGYNFSTWTSDSTDSISAQTPVEIADDHTLSAVWDIKRYSIFFSANDSTLGKVSYNTISGVPHFATITISNTQLTIYSDTVVTIDAIPFETIKGYEVTLQDWTVNDAVVTSWTVEDFVEFHANFVQNALSYNVTFKANGGNIDNQTKTIRYDSTYGSLPSVTRTGYTFVGWYTDNNTFKKEIKPSTTMQTAYDHNIYAKWEINLFEISIVSNDEELGTVTKETLTNIPYGTKVSVTNNTIKIGFNYVSARVGYIYGYIIRFVNWTINNNNVENNMTVEDNFSIQANFTRQAKNIIITFNANTKDNYGQNLDGSPKLDEISKIIPFATTFGDLPTPTLEGYTFDGWYYDNQYSKKVKDTDSIDTIENLTLYAKWVKIVEPFNISEVLIYSGIGVVVVAIVVVAIVLLRKEKNKEKDTFDLGF